MTRAPRALAVALLVLAAPDAAAAEDPATVVSDLSFPAGIAFDSTGETMYVTERPGRILAFDAGGGNRRTVASVPTVTQGETGLLGIAVSPDDRFVYAFATAQDQSNVVWRVPARGGDPEAVVEGLPGSTYHNGGGVAFGQDGMLYVSNGERHDSSLSQDPSALGGKVYRYTEDGDVPDDNPFGDSAAFAIGLRNPFGLTIDPVTGDPLVTENGPESHDEVNRIVAGGNYGWPVVSGAAGGADTSDLPGEYHDPLADYEQIIVPTGIAVADPANASDDVAGDVFFGTYGDQTIRRLVLNDARDQVVRQQVWFESPEPIVALAWGPRGVYFSTPGAVKVFDLARPEEGAAPEHDDDRDAAPPPAGEPENGGAPVAAILLAGAAAILIAALAFAFWPRRR